MLKKNKQLKLMQELKLCPMSAFDNRKFGDAFATVIIKQQFIRVDALNIYYIDTIGTSPSVHADWLWLINLVAHIFTIRSIRFRCLPRVCKCFNNVLVYSKYKNFVFAHKIRVSITCFFFYLSPFGTYTPFDRLLVCIYS